MKKLLLACAVLALAHAPLAAQTAEVARWQRQARNVTIVRDDWGIPHIYGKTDADAVFGLMYAQAEDDFNRVETNYLAAIGRLAEAEGESRIWQDLRMKIFVDPDSMRALYRASPPWLKTLMNAWADGLNFYLHRHPDVRPRVLTRFEPWMALTFSEGSIGRDIERIDLGQLEGFYGNPTGERGGGLGARGEGLGTRDQEQGTRESGFGEEPGGSNGIAIAPANTANHHALLLINPHTSFFFRAEVQVQSEQGLNAYGAVTWGQFFVYQGFNDRIGWMHTSSGVDNIDEYLETVTQGPGGFTYRYGTADLPVTTSTIRVPYRTATGMAERTITVFRTRHGPVVRRAGERWVSVRLMDDPLHALIQSYTRTKARDLAAFRQTLELHTNSSNNTVLASADGDIAYFHSNFIPRRDTSFVWTRPVDGSNPATEWHGVLSVDETPHLLNPASGWIYNSNDAPWHAAGPDSPRRADFPAYVEAGGETARGRHAVRVLEHARGFTLDSLLAAAYDSYLPFFERTLPTLFAAWDSLAADDPLKAKLQEPIALLRGWDLRWSAASTATSLAVFWSDLASRRTARFARIMDVSAEEFLASRAAPRQLLEPLAWASDSLQAHFGSWRTPWGEINRFQRLTGDIVQPFNDSGPSIPVAFTSGTLGSLASFGARAWPGTRKWYGTSGNSFVAVVEFGDSVRARAVTAGGESGHPGSPHFNDQAARYAAGNLREVYFYRSQLRGHTEREYHPGELTAPLVRKSRWSRGMRHSWTLLACCAAVAACGKDANGPSSEPPVAAVALSPASLVLVPDSTVQLTALLTDSLGHTLTGRAVTWTSSDTTCATVSAAGVVRGRAFPAWMPTGYARITATAEGKTGTATALLVRKLAGLRVLPDTLTIFTGETALIGAAVTDTAGAWVWAGSTTWSSADTTRAVVDSTGTVRGVRAGTVEVTAHAVGLSATGYVTVRSPVTSLQVLPAETTLAIGQSAQFAAVLRDSAGNALAGRPVTWTVLGRDVVTLTADGLATARIAGPTRLVATAEGRADTADLTANVDAPFRSVAAGELHTCATTTAGTTYCWGNGWYGQLGTGSGVAGPTSSAGRVTGGVQFQSLAAQGDRTCGLDGAGVAYCWGLDTFGALGNPAGVGPCTYADSCRGTPLAVTDTTHFAALSAGGWHVCGLAPTGAADCWGQNWLGELGIGTHDLLPHAPTPVIGGIAFTALAAGGVHTCGLAAGGQAYCWGAYLQSQTLDSVASASPQLVAGAPAFATIAAGSYHVCGLTAAGAAYCWGENYALTPALIPSATAFSSIVAGSAYTCALDAAGAAYCWGANDYGQLGNGTTTATATPTAVVGGLHFSAIWAGAYHVCGLATSGRLYCWGDDYNGELGNGGYTPLPLPTLVLGQP